MSYRTTPDGPLKEPTEHYVGDACEGGHREDACRACAGAGKLMKEGMAGIGWAWAACRRCNGTGIEPMEEPP